eukprot:scaffold33364_cov26-Cyclotella_meneghiniana.AAC.1
MIIATSIRVVSFSKEHVIFQVNVDSISIVVLGVLVGGVVGVDDRDELGADVEDLLGLLVGRYDGMAEIEGPLESEADGVGETDGLALSLGPTDGACAKEGPLDPEGKAVDGAADSDGRDDLDGALDCCEGEPQIDGFDDKDGAADTD